MRRFHSLPRLLRNKYYFYDLASSQPHSDHSDKAAAKSMVFDPKLNAPTESMEERVAKVFGSLGSREESRKEAQAKAVTVLGIKIPARPEEPTNCCGSGCINCVWELYKDEVDDWRQLRKKAQSMLMKPENKSVKWPKELGPEPTNRGKATVDTQDDEDVGLDPGIAAFIATEKRLHEKKRKRAAQQSSLSQA